MPSTEIKTLTFVTSDGNVTFNLNDTSARSLIAALQTLVNGKQDTLVSGSNIKTINGVPVLGSGNLNITAVANSDFNHTTNTAVSGSVTITFLENSRCSAMYSTSSDLSVALIVENRGDNYLWIRNTGNNEIDVTISSVRASSAEPAISDVFVPSDGITVPAGCVCEIGVIRNPDGVFITSRTDLRK